MVRMSYSGGGIMTPSQDSEATPSRTKDREDVALAARGDVRAFARLYGAHSARIFNLARRMTSSDSAVDITQDIFLRAWEKLGTFRGESAFGTWLHRLAINVILARRSTLRNEQRRISDEEGIMETLPARPGRAAVHYLRRERTQPGELAAAHLAAPGPDRAGHPGRHYIPSPPARLRLAAGRRRPSRS